MSINHDKRIQWVNKKREAILEKIDAYNNKYKQNGVNTENTEEFLIRELQRRLEESRNEVAEWLFKYKEAEDEIKYYNKIVKQKESTIDERNKTINELRSRLREMMKEK